MLTNAVALSRMPIAERASLGRGLARMFDSGPTVEDVAQNLYPKVQWVGDDPPILHKLAFLYKLATNLANDWLRTEHRRNALFEPIDPVPDIASMRRSPTGGRWIASSLPNCLLLSRN